MMSRTPPPDVNSQSNHKSHVASSCQKCEEQDNERMVQCDKCDLWFHYECANVTQEIENSPWNCKKCSRSYEPRSEDKAVTHNQGTKSISKSTSSKQLKKSAARRIEIELKRLEEEKELQEKRDKEYLEKKYKLLHDANEDDSSEDEEELYECELQTDRVSQWLQNDPKSNQPATTVNQHLSSSRNTAQFGNTEPPNRQSYNPPPQVCRNSLSSHQHEGIINFDRPIIKTVPSAFQQVQKPTDSSDYVTMGHTQPQYVPISDPNAGLATSFFINTTSPPTAPSCPTIPGPQTGYNNIAPFVTGNFPTQEVITLNPQQLAARHVMPKELPTFSGRPEEWPLFISTFESSTHTCGFSSEENLVRLQRCLKGPALDAVRGRLMHPSGVTDVIRTLRILYGRPEMVINTLIQKLRHEAPPRADKLESLIHYALAVQNICAIMETSGMHSHLYNPNLLQELVGKLPAHIKLNWAMYKRNISNVNISTFSGWLFEIAEAAGDVTDYPFGPAYVDQTFERKPFKGKAYINAHQENSNITSTPAREMRKCYACKGQCKSLVACKAFNEHFIHSQRWAVVKEHKLCRLCLLLHGQNRCNVRTPCGKNGCTRKHHRLLHNDNVAIMPTIPQPEQTLGVGQHCNPHQQLDFDRHVLFRIVPVVLSSNGISVKTYAFLDDGSSLTLLNDQIADQLGLQGEHEPLCLKWTANTHRMEENSKIVSLEIASAANPDKTFHISKLHTVRSLNLPTQSISALQLGEQFPHLRNLPIQSYENAVPGILIGLDNWKLGLPLKSKEANDDQPVASKTRLGWTICGPCGNLDVTQTISYSQYHSYKKCDCEHKSNDDLHHLVKQFFAIESMGIVKNEKSLISKEDERALAILQSTTNFTGQRFETGLLWKFDEVTLPDSYGMAKRRFSCLEKKMIRDPEMADALQKKISDHIEKGYIRQLTEYERQQPSKHTWYLPIFSVTNPNKPGKFRMVWDAAAKVNGVSLNSVLMKGPDQLASLQSILFRFRERRVGICGDIKEMFHQVRILEKDQQAQRFLWRTNKSDAEPDIYVMTVMTFGATCSPSSAQFVKNQNALRFAEELPRAVQAIINNHYVDDLLDSVDTEDEAIKLAKDVRFIHSQGGFEMHNWISNSSIFQKSFCVDKNGPKDMSFTDEAEADKVLGMWWCTKSDQFTFRISFNDKNSAILNGQQKPTKREVLRILMTIYDPLGLLANFLVYVKILLQEIWRSSVDWDEQITESHFKKWIHWLQLLPLVQKLRIPRSYLRTMTFNNENSTQLHVFVDASENAYAAVAYLRVESGGQVECSLVSAKTRVAPLKIISIPRLELEAAVLGIRLASTIQKGLSINKTQRFFWTDSKTVLCWINSEQRKYKQFVAFRVGEILESSELSEWNYVPTKINVADEATKWHKTPEITIESRWYQGPDFLRLSVDQWPGKTAIPETTCEEERPHLLHSAFSIKLLIDTERFSSWNRLLHTQAYILRFVFNVQSKLRKRSNRTGPLQHDEFLEAENKLYRQAQLTNYADEVATLELNQNRPAEQRRTLKKSSVLYKQSPYLDSQGVLRTYGRVDAAIGIDNDVKRPILMSGRSHITQLIIRWYHEKFHHHNHETVINEIRQKFAIPRLRAALKNIRRVCQFCKNLNAIPSPPEMAQLPSARLAAFSRPFSYIGIDYFGPMTIKIGRRSEKRWGVIITCLTTRAIHIEVASSLSSDSCILCLRNFIARRGTPLEIYSDNGTNFHGANRELKEAQDNSSVLAEVFTNNTTKWIFNPPASPHMGGSWERLVRSIKTTLNLIMPNRNPSEELLRSMLLEVESTVNCRPLTYIPIENENNEALTPNHFLLGSSSGIKPIGTFSDEGTLLRKNWSTAQQYANSFWKRWIREYLPTLTRRSKWFHPAKPIRKGDIVVIVDENLPRNDWPKGKVIEIVTSKDGQVRRAMVQTAHGIFERPAVKLAVLDVRVEEECSKSPKDGVIPGRSVSNTDSLKHYSVSI